MDGRMEKGEWKKGLRRKEGQRRREKDGKMIRERKIYG